MNHDFSPAEPIGLNAKFGPSYRDLPLAEGISAFVPQHLDRIIDLLNRAWDLSPRLLVAQSELTLPGISQDDPGSAIAEVMHTFFRSLNALIQQDILDHGGNVSRGRHTRLWGLWAADLSQGSSVPRIQVAHIVNYDACCRLGPPGSTEASMARSIHGAYTAATGRTSEEHRPKVHLGETWLHPIYGYGDLSGYKAAFRRLSEFCRTRGAEDFAFGCGLVPCRVTDGELYDPDSFLFPPNQRFGRSVASH